MWHQYMALCPDCRHEITYLKLHLNEDCHILLEGVCAKCGIEVSIEVDTLQACTALARYEAQSRGN